MKKLIFVGLLSLYQIALAQQNKNCTLAYSWSPGMSYSMIGLDDIQHAGPFLNLQVIYIRDPLLKSFGALADSQQLLYQQSADFTANEIQEGYANHFPGYFLVNQTTKKRDLLRLGYTSFDHVITLLKEKGCVL